MECDSIIKRNKTVLEQLCIEFEIEEDINLLLQNYVSVFTSYEQDRERLRIIGVVKKNFNPADKKSTKRKTLAFIGKKTLKKLKVDMEVMRLKAELLCKLWQQTNNLSTIEQQEENIQNYSKKLKEKIGESYL
jgi:hypothetical protein